MADKTFKLEIVSPAKVLFNGEVVSFSAPGVLGGFQVLYNHAPLLAEVDTGEVKVLKTDGTEIFFAVSGGFVSVFDNNVILLAECAERANEIDLERARIARDNSRKKLAEKLSESELYEAHQALKRAINRIKIAEKR